MLGVPKTVLRDPQQVEDMREQRAMQQQAQQEAMMQQQMAETAKTQGEAAKAVSDPAVQGVMGQAQAEAESQGM